MPPPTTTTNLTITNPLVLYRSLLATKRIEPSEPQHRLAIHLQNLYHRLKDYEPTLEYAQRIQQISSTIRRKDADTQSVPENLKRQSPHFLTSFRERKASADSLALTRTLTSADEAKQMQSPKGLLLHGDVGTGKSMLVDLLATSLPTGKKARWHFSAFMLDTFSRLERVRRERQIARVAASDGKEVSSSVSNGQSEALVVLARDLIERSPIVFLDEFQLPDRASAKILSSLFTAFFQLGGVLVATSNRMPEELAKAAGVEIAPSPRSLPGWAGLKSLLSRHQEQGREKNLFSGNADFAEFLEVLKARCETWDMGTGKDWRRRESEAAREKKKLKQNQPIESLADSMESQDTEPFGDEFLPSNYFVSSTIEVPSTDLPAKLQSLLSSSGSAIPWVPTTLHVYARPLTLTHTYNGTTLCTFSSLCASNLGPADYITIASTFHTLILTDIPVMSILQKNEARRLISLLDALYEARCRLIVSAAADPDNIFFPETDGRIIKGKTSTDTINTSHSNNASPSSRQPASSSSLNEEEDATYAETFSDMYQDLTSPFRPNISSYTPPSSTPTYTPSPLPANPFTSSPSPTQPTAHPSTRSILADEDADFGPVYGSGRSASAPTTSTTTTNNNNQQSPNLLNFTNTSQFTGADERFAFARARSRLWEMCGASWWEARPVETQAEIETWWRPMSREGRGWEGSLEERNQRNQPKALDRGGAKREEVEKNGNEGDKEMGDYPHGATSPFRTHPESPPKIGWTHAWGMMAWGKKAGAWGKGVDGLGERGRKNRESDGGEEKGDKAGGR